MVGSQYVDKGRGETWELSVEGGGHSGPRGGGTQSGKGYRLRSDRWRAVAVTTAMAKKGELSLYYIEG